MNNMAHYPRIMVVCSGGGHLREAKIALEGVAHAEFFYVTNPLPHLRQSHDVHLRFIKDPHKSLFHYFINFFQSVKILFQCKPDIIVSTGAGIAIFIFILGKLTGAKTIFIESGSRILYPSRTGSLLYRFADHFIIQSAPLFQYYPKAVLKEVL
jgi:beta-1,4-N-acetylglucosaminyltransferase